MIKTKRNEVLNKKENFLWHELFQNDILKIRSWFSDFYWAIEFIIILMLKTL